MDGETEWRTRPFDPTPEQWRKLHADQRCGPRYPALPSVEKWRRLNRGRDLTPEETREYGRAVLAAIHALNHAGLQRSAVSLRCTVWTAKGAAARNRAQLETAANADRHRRTDKDIVAQFKEEHPALYRRWKTAHLRAQLKERLSP